MYVAVKTKERYKLDWMSERRERWRPVFVNEHEPKPRAKPLTRLLEWLKG